VQEFAHSLLIPPPAINSSGSSKISPPASEIPRDCSLRINLMRRERLIASSGHIDAYYCILTSSGPLAYHVAMRTTISIDDDVYADVKQYAESKDIALGKAVSDLVRRALRPPFRMRLDDQGFWVTDLPPGAPEMTPEHVKRIQEELDLEDVKKYRGELD